MRGSIDLRRIRGARTWNRGFVRSGRCDRSSSCEQKLPAINNKTIRVIRGNGSPAFPLFFPSSPICCLPPPPSPRVRVRVSKNRVLDPSNVRGNSYVRFVQDIRSEIRPDEIRFRLYYRIITTSPSLPPLARK